MPSQPGNSRPRGPAATAVDYSNVVSVDLFGGEERPIAKAGCVANFAMCGIEPLQHFGFIVGDVDAGNSLRENVTTDFDRASAQEIVRRVDPFFCTSILSVQYPPRHCHPERSEGSQIISAECEESNQRCFALLNMTVIRGSSRLPRLSRKFNVVTSSLSFASSSKSVLRRFLSACPSHLHRCRCSRFWLSWRAA